MRLACMAPEGMDRAQVDALCRGVAAGMAEALGREVRVAEDGADVTLEVVRLDRQGVGARLHWPGRAPGPEVEMGVVDAGLAEASLDVLARGLLKVSPPG